MNPRQHINTIEVKLHDLSQLFNSMDPSPFHEKDLDDDAEQFIVSWATEFPVDEPMSLMVHLAEVPPEGDPQKLVAEAVHNFFAYQAKLKRRELRELISRGRISLIIGLVCLAISLAVGQLIGKYDTKGFGWLLQESLLIGGWVAMWRPMQIFLHDWWPVRHRRRLYEAMSRMDVQVKMRGNEPNADAAPAMQPSQVSR